MAATRYYQVLQGAAAAPRTRADEFERLVSADCECRDVVTLLHRLASEDHRLLFTVDLGTPRVARSTAAEGTVFIQVDQSAGREVDSHGALVRSLPATTGTYVLDLVMRDGRWIVKQITRST